MPKTKIICTLGPATDDPAILSQLIADGMDVARFNFSHGTHEDQKQRLELLKKTRDELGKPVAAIMDTKGPEIRLGLIEGGRAHLKMGDSFTLTTRELVGNAHCASVSYADLPGDVKVGGRVLIDDAKVALSINEVTATDIICTVENDGYIADRKGINVPGARLSMPFISKQDYDDILFAARQGFDYIAASFVRTADDVKEIRMLLSWNGGDDVKIISKIENKQGVDNIDEILQVSDGIMVARGDMGAELPIEDVPVIQKLLINKVCLQGKIVITATQMLDSMISCPRPTRAEATDVANAIYDGTTAIMLSGETAAGKFPLEALRTMVKIAERTEADINYIDDFRHTEYASEGSVTHAICHAACTSAFDINAEAVVAFTLSGMTAREVSAFRPGCRIIACTSSPRTYRQLSLCWGVTPFMAKDEADLDEMFERGISDLGTAGLLKTDDRVVLTAGVPIGHRGSTNLIKVLRVK